MPDQIQIMIYTIAIIAVSCGVSSIDETISVEAITFSSKGNSFPIF